MFLTINAFRNFMNALQYYIDTTTIREKYSVTSLINLGTNYFNNWKDSWGNKLTTTQANSNSIINTKNATDNSTKAVILMIDDEEICLLSMELLLLDSNYSLITTNTGKKGLEYIKNNSDIIDLILLDLMLPDVYGLEILEILKTDPTLKKIPIILQTGSFDEKDIQKALELGVTECIRKPYKKNSIVKAIAKALSKI